MKLSIFKFGGASIATPEAMQTVTQIIKQSYQHPLIIVISAIGKTTNALEEVVRLFFEDREKAIEHLTKIKQFHFDYAKSILSTPDKVIDKLTNHFVEIDWLLEDEPMDEYDYVYDQIVSIGEIASSTILAAALKEKQLPVIWHDARDIFKTDRTFREGQLNWSETEKSVFKKIKPNLASNIFVTQGFIGSTSDNETTTLGREGSDFSGAILANILSAENYTIWKDVPGVLNADPKTNTNTIQLKNISYQEAVEMSYYGAKVIHPKTIKPLQNKHIPLHVKSFTELENSGTIIHTTNFETISKAIFIQKPNQVLLTLFTKDFSFFGEEFVSQVLTEFKNNLITVNLMQRGAIQCSFVIDADEDAIKTINKQLQNEFLIEQTSNLKLDTLRHYKQSEVDELSNNKTIILEQKNATTYQIVYTD